ncbi:Uncharacterised protein g4358 [Pycnogonum litorale]
MASNRTMIWTCIMLLVYISRPTLSDDVGIEDGNVDDGTQNTKSKNQDECPGCYQALRKIWLNALDKEATVDDDGEPSSWSSFLRRRTGTGTLQETLNTSERMFLEDRAKKSSAKRQQKSGSDPGFIIARGRKSGAVSGSYDPFIFVRGRRPDPYSGFLLQKRRRRPAKPKDPFIIVRGKKDDPSVIVREGKPGVVRNRPSDQWSSFDFNKRKLESKPPAKEDFQEGWFLSPEAELPKYP